MIPVAESMQIDLSKVGIKLNLKVMEFQTHRPHMRDRKLAGTGWLHRTGIPPDPASHLTVFYSAGGIAGGVELPELEDLFARLAKTADDKERDRIIRSIGDVVYMGYHVIPIVDLPALFGVNQKKIGEWKTTGYYGFTHLEHVQKR
jgi:ABC-type transport system substrate-binding protein